MCWKTCFVLWLTLSPFNQNLFWKWQCHVSVGDLNFEGSSQGGHCHLFQPVQRMRLRKTRFELQEKALFWFSGSSSGSLNREALGFTDAVLLLKDASGPLSMLTQGTHPREHHRCHSKCLLGSQVSQLPLKRADLQSRWAHHRTSTEGGIWWCQHSCLVLSGMPCRIHNVCTHLASVGHSGKICVFSYLLLEAQGHLKCCWVLQRGNWRPLWWICHIQASALTGGYSETLKTECTWAPKFECLYPKLSLRPTLTS